MRPWLRYALVGAAALALGAAVGRYLTPPKVVTTVEVQTKEVVRTVTIEAKARDVVRYVRVTETPTPTGPARVTEISERINTHTDTHTNTDAATDTTAKATKVVTAPPSWGIAALVGVGGLGAGPIGPAIGAQVSGRVWGPVRLGGWGLYEPSAKRSAAGLSVGVEF